MLFIRHLRRGFKINDPAGTGTLRFASGESSKTISIAFNVWNRSLKMCCLITRATPPLSEANKETVVTILRGDTAASRKNPN